MTHLDEGRLRAYLDGQLDPDEMSEVESWIEEDVGAQQTLESLRRRSRRVSELLSALDVQAPTERVRGALKHGVTGATGGRSARRIVYWARRSRLAQAAALVLLLAGAASATIPGFPVREWLVSQFGGASQEPADEGRAELEPGGEAPAAATSAEPIIRVLTNDGPVTVELNGVPAGTEITLAWISGESAALYAPQGGTDLIAEAGRIGATVRGGPLRIEIPGTATRVSFRVNGRIYLTGTADDLQVGVPYTERSDTLIHWSGPSSP